MSTFLVASQEHITTFGRLRGQVVPISSVDIGNKPLSVEKRAHPCESYLVLPRPRDLRGFRHNGKLHRFAQWTMVIKVLVLDSQNIRACHLLEEARCSSVFSNIMLTVYHPLWISPFAEFIYIAWRCGIECPTSSTLLQRHGCYSLKGYSDLPELRAPPTPGKPARHHDNPIVVINLLYWYMMVRHSGSTTVDMGQHNSYYAGGQGVGDTLAGQ